MLRPENLMTAFQRALLTGALLVLVSGHAQSADPPHKLEFADLDKDGNGKLSLEEYLASPGLADPKVAGQGPAAPAIVRFPFREVINFQFLSVAGRRSAANSWPIASRP